MSSVKLNMAIDQEVRMSIPEGIRRAHARLSIPEEAAGEHMRD